MSCCQTDPAVVTWPGGEAQTYMEHQLHSKLDEAVGAEMQLQIAELSRHIDQPHHNSTSPFVAKAPPQPEHVTPGPSSSDIQELQAFVDLDADQHGAQPATLMGQFSDIFAGLKERFDLMEQRISLLSTKVNPPSDARGLQVGE